MKPFITPPNGHAKSMPWLYRFCTFVCFTLLLFSSPLRAQFLLLDDMEGNGPCSGRWDFYAGNTTTGKVQFGVNNPAPGGLNTSAKVAKFLKDSSSFEWMTAGCSLPDSFDLRGNTVFKLLVYSDVKEEVMFKLQPGTNYNKAVFFTYKIKNINTWEEATFDFATVRNRTDLNRLEVHYADGKKANAILYFDLVQGPDPASITLGSKRIAMGQEAGAVIQATVRGNTFKQTLDKAQWTARWPAGIGIDSLQRVNDTVVNIVLAGTATENYSRYDLKLTIAGNQLDSTGAAQYVVKGSVVFSGNPSYTLIYEDNFNGSGKPDPTKWTVDPRPKGWINGEQQVYTDSSYDNAVLRNGSLVITGRKDYPNYNTTEPWSSGRVISQNKMDFRYGKVEVRAKLPRARGSWPAIWLMPTTSAYGDWPKSGELDIMEHVGNKLNTVLSTVHTQNNNWMNGSHTSGSKVIPGVDSIFHVYSMEWNEDSIRFMYDSIHCYTYVNPKTDWKDWPFDQKFHIILNVAIGGGMGGSITDTDWPDSMLVDYVRVYQKGIGTPLLDSLSISPANRAYISGKSYQYTYKVFDQNDFPLPVTPTWSITGTGNSIINTGKATVVVPGTVTATAVYNGDTLRAIANATIRPASYKPIPARIEAEAFDYSNTCCTETAQDTSGVLDVSYISNTSFMEYDIQVPWTGMYRIQLRAAVNTASTANLLLDDSVYTTLQLPATGGWQTWKTITTKALQLPGGNHTLRVQSGSSGWNFNWLKVMRDSDLTLTRIVVTPDSTSVFVNARKQFKAAVYASDSSRVDLPLTWSVPAKGGVIDGKGVITASDTPGVYYVKAHYNSLFGKAKINVLALPRLARIKVVPDSLTLPFGATQQYTTQGFDQYGSAFAFTGPTWSVSGSGNSVTTAGAVTATTTPGTYTVTATKDSISGSALFTTGYGCTFKKRWEAEISTSRSTVPTLETTTDTSGGQNFTGIGYNHWFGYSTLNIPVKGRYNVSFRVLTTAPAAVKLANTGVTYGIVNLPNTNGQWATITDTMTIPAISYANVIQHSGTFKFNWFAIDNCAVPPAPDSGSLLVNSIAAIVPTDEKPSSAWKIYPNPVHESITVEPGNRNFTRMQLLDMSGRTLQQWAIPKGSSKFSRSVGNLPPGMYILRLEGKAVQPMTLKIIKQ